VKAVVPRKDYICLLHVDDGDNLIGKKEYLPNRGFILFCFQKSIKRFNISSMKTSGTEQRTWI
jgi:hypothetical protein